MPSTVATLTKTSTSWGRWLFVVGWAPAFVFFLHQVSVWITNGEYWWDEPMHVVGGMAIAWMGLTALRRWQAFAHIPPLPRWFAFVALTGFVMIAGVVWEWYEYIRWITIDPTMDLTLPDTLKDLAMDTLGGLVVAWYWCRRES